MTDLILPTARGADQPAGNLDDSVYNRLLKERIIFLGSEVTDQVANRICAQLLLLAAEDSDRDIWLYINSPGGSLTAVMAIYDTMQLVRPDIETCCLGQAACAAAVLLRVGTASSREGVPLGRI